MTLSRTNSPERACDALMTVGGEFIYRGADIASGALGIWLFPL